MPQTTATPEQIQAVITAAQNMANAANEFQIADMNLDASLERLAEAETDRDVQEALYTQKNESMQQANSELQGALSALVPPAPPVE